MEVRRHSRSGLALLVGACILSQGCETTPQGGYGTAAPSATCERIATLRLAGERRVFLNGKQAEDGAAVCNGDRVSTGADSSAFVQLPRGGLVQFDQNTDPIFRVLQELVIEVFGLNQGQIFAQSPAGGQIVVRNPDGDLETQGTQINLRTAPEMSVLTVIEGRVNLTRPQVVAISGGEQVGFTRGALEYRRALSPADVAGVVRWRSRYPLPDGRQPPPEDSAKTSSVLPGILGVIAAGIIAHEIYSDRDSDKAPPRTDQPSDYPQHEVGVRNVR